MSVLMDLPRRSTHPVLHGRVLGIFVFLPGARAQDVDGRAKPGQDDGGWA